MRQERAEIYNIKIENKNKTSIIQKLFNFLPIKNVKLINKNISGLSMQADIQSSKTNRFELDPKDQIRSQKWARENDLEVLCCAHSHPSGENKPSEIDLFLQQSPSLMVISNKDGDLKAWWIKNKLNFHSVKIQIFSLT